MVGAAMVADNVRIWLCYGDPTKPGKNNFQYLTNQSNQIDCEPDWNRLKTMVPLLANESVAA
jgi:hypothetical protein